MNIVHALITIAIAFVVAFAATWILGFEDPVEKTTQTHAKTETTNQTEVIASPLSGKVIPLNTVNDHVFSNELIGKGIAILPDQNEVKAPFAGEIVTMMESKHAVGLRSDNGIELLIHVGIDTVSLKGEYFETHVKQGDRVEQGDTLVTFDRQSIQAKGYETVTPIIITNHDEFNALDPIKEKRISSGEPLMHITKLEA